MSVISCDACNELRENAPEFVQSGVTDNVCTSLENNTGFNPSLTVLHDNCEDLHNANDCLIGRMKDELEAYDVCDWKDFNNKYMSNLYEMLKAIICSGCGQWTRIEELCEKLELLINPDAHPYGIFPHDPSQGVDTSFGTIHSKGGAPLLRPLSPGPGGRAGYGRFGAGIGYSQREFTKCDGSGTEIYEWITPWIERCYISAAASPGDVLWSVDKAAAQSIMGISDGLWLLLSESTGAWRTNPMEDGRYIWLLVNVSGGRLNVIYEGTSYPQSGITSDTVVLSSGPSRRYTTAAS